MSSSNLRCRRLVCVLACAVGLTTGALAQPADADLAPDALIIVAAPLYRTGDVADAVATYVDDLRGEGWQPRVIKVNNVEDEQADYICPRPEELKQVVRQHQRRGLKGFVLIGSSPAIPTAYWRHHTNCDPTDLYYADMSDWGPVTDNGAYWPYTGEVTHEKLAELAPELFWGRIDPIGICDGDLDRAAELVTAYLKRVHRYRTEGSWLPTAAQRRYLLSADCDDYKGARPLIERVGVVADSAHVVLDDSLTSGPKWTELLRAPHGFGMMFCHSWPDGHQFMAVYDDTYVHEACALEHLKGVRPVAHYFNLFCCSACRFDDVKLGHMPNLGATYLFHSDHMLNINGSSGGWGYIPKASFWEVLADGTPIGEAVRTWFVEWMPEGEQGCPKGIMLGDPMLRYKLPPLQNRAPWITTSLEGSRGVPGAEALMGEPVVIVAHDPDGDALDLTLQGLPSGATVERGDGWLLWTPSAADVGATLSLQAEVRCTGEDGQSRLVYVEEFTVSVRHGKPVALENGGFETAASVAPQGWSCKGEGWYQAGRAAGVAYAGEAALKVSAAEPSQVDVTRAVTLEPYTRYALLGRIRTAGIASHGEGPGGACVQLGETRSQLLSGDSPKDMWLPVRVIARSDGDGKLRVACTLTAEGDGCTGDAWFDGLRLVELADTPPTNLDFELATADGRPVGWAPAGWEKGRPALATTDATGGRGGSSGAKLAITDAPVYKSFFQRVAVEPGRRYRLTGCVKTQGVAEGYGAAIGVVRDVSSSGLHGDHDWTLLTCEFDAKDRTEVVLECLLGKPRQDSKGVAWFDDLELECIGATPPKVAADDQEAACGAAGCP